MVARIETHETIHPLEKEDLSPPPAWHEKIRATIPREDYFYGPKLDSKRTKVIREEFDEKIIDECKNLEEESKTPHVKTVFDDDSLKMPGVAILAAYLRRKKGLDNLFVCKSLEAFQAKLNEISQWKGNIRIAFVLPCGPEDRTDDDEEYDGDAGHKIALCLEKVGDSIKIVLLDSLGSNPRDYNPIIAKSPAEHLQESPGDDTVILWYIFHSQLDWNKTEFYYSFGSRQETGYCYETFALKDAISFLQDPQFFDKIKKSKVVIEAPARNIRIQLQQIDQLPPAFMKGTQDNAALEDYIQHYPQVNTSEGSKSDPEKLQQLLRLKKTIEKHTIQIEKIKEEEVKIKTQNHYINHHSMKYHLIALNALKMTAPEELQKIISETLLTVPRPVMKEGEPPHTLSDLARWNTLTFTVYKSPT